MEEKQINILCYADDAARIAESEDNQQLYLDQFNLITRSLNMTILFSKIKCMVTS